MLMTSRALNQDVSQAKRIAREEPVFVTDHGRPTHVLMAMEAYRQFAGQTETLSAVLTMDDLIAFDPDWRAIRRGH